MTAEAIAAAFREACRAELRALKPGNVHIFADGHRMTVADFEASAEAAAPHIAARCAGVGERILGAVQATRERTGQNTNLGIILLCAPLAVAAERKATADKCGKGGPAQPGRVRGRRQTAPSLLRDNVASVLAALTVHDAALAFQAIALANPGGLGTAAGHDVREPARITLLDAMRAASARDGIARQYARDFEDIFEADASVLGEGATDPATAEGLYLHFLTRFPDSHIVRKFGFETAEEVRALVRDVDRRLASAAGDAARRPLLLSLDATLKERGVNPGTSADFTVATVFARTLQTHFR